MVSFGVLGALFAMLFKWFPAADVRWRNAVMGGLATSLLHPDRKALSSTYGAAASIVVLLVWVYNSAQFVLFGAEVTHVLEQPRLKPSADPSARS